MPRSDRPLRTRLLALAGLAALALAAVTSAEAFARFSGHVMEVDLTRGILVVEELGRRGLPIRHQVRVEADTPVVAASRLRLGDMRGQSAFGELSVSLVDVLVGDFVIVEGEDDFVNMLCHVLVVLGMEPRVVAHEDATPAGFEGADLVIVGPGPGDPRDGTQPKITDLRGVPATPQESALLGEAVDACCHDPDQDVLVGEVR